MIISKSTLLIGLILTLLSDPILCKRGSSHSYPKPSGGLSGGGHRSGGLSGGGSGYPSSGGHPSLSGGSSGGSHAYPSPGSSGGSHAYPSPGSSGGSHAYPSPGSSGGSHAYPSPGSSGGSHAYPSPGSSGGSHAYPPSGKSHGYPNSGGGLSGGGASYPSGSSGGSHAYPPSGKNHGYPSSGGGLSGSGHSSSSNNKIQHKTTVHHHYHYSPPAQISYAPHYGGVPVNYPVYRGTPPTYVYQYKDSGSKYGTLLAGLALMNLGTTAYVATHSHGGHSNYKQQPGEVCKFAIKKENGDYEETRIDCQIISGFIIQHEMETQKPGNNSTITTTVTNVTVVNTTNVGAYQPGPVAPVPGNVLYNMLPNGTLVPVTSSVVTTTTTNTTLVSALDVRGKAVEVTPGMQCFVIRQSSMSNMRKTVPCGLLQTYADKSLKRNSATKHLPMFTFAAAVLAYCVPYLVLVI